MAVLGRLMTIVFRLSHDADHNRVSTFCPAEKYFRPTISRLLNRRIASYRSNVIYCVKHFISTYVYLGHGVGRLAALSFFSWAGFWWGSERLTCVS